MVTIEDSGFIIHLRKFGESSLIVKIFSRNNGIISGFMKFALDRKNNFVQQVGNYVDFTWSARDGDDLGRLKLNLVASHSIFTNPLNLTLFNLSLSMVDCVLAERDDAHEIFELFEKMVFSFRDMGLENILNFVAMGLKTIDHLGIGLSLEECAVTGSRENLYYLSPKTGRAVTREVGERYKDKVFIIPKCFKTPCLEKEDILNALNIIEFFIKKFALENNLLYKYSAIDFFSNELVKIISKAYAV